MHNITNYLSKITNYGKSVYKLDFYYISFDHTIVNTMG